MPFQQPTPITVRQIHFRGKTYTFPVESVLAPGSKKGVLQLETSTGYLLTTSANGIPQVTQTIPYVEQPDGSWLAKDTVNLTVNAAALINGSVTLYDPLGETMSLPVRIAPSLFVDSTEISFDETKLGDSTATILNIRQRGALTPIHVSVEPQHQFAIADARTARISVSNLTITPAFEGSNVIVIYKPTRAGRNVARLVINAPYETKLVQLVGQPGGILGQFQWPEIPRWQMPRLPRPKIPQLLQRPKMPRLQWPKIPRMQRPEIPRVYLPETPQAQLPAIPRLQLPKTPRIQWPSITNRGPIIGGLAVVAFGAVLWMAYTMLVQPKNKIDLSVLPQPSAATQVSLSVPAAKPEKPVAQAPKIKPEEKSTEEYTPVVESSTSESSSQSEEKITTKKKPEQGEPVKSVASASAKPKPSTSVFSAEQVSDLEKELNTSAPSKQP